MDALLSMKYRLHASLSAAARRCFCLCIVLCLISCAMVPKQTYLNNQSLLGINKVAVVVSVSAPEVSYTTGGFMLFPEDGLIGIFEKAIRYGSDQEHTSKINEHVDISLIEDKTAQSFMQPLKKGNLFQSVEQTPNKNQDSRQLIAIGYDAVISLTVREISIERVPGDYVSLSAHVHGQMEKLMSGEIVWDREEVVTNPEPHTLDYYKENGLKDLDTMLEKAGKTLAYDFIYLIYLK